MIQELSTYKIELTSPHSLLIEWDFELSSKSINALKNLKTNLLSKDDDIHFITSAFKSVLVKFKNIEVDIKNKKDSIEKHIESLEDNKLEESNIKLFKIPVCYEDFGKDMQQISKKTGLSETEVVNIHSEQVYMIYFIGFLPGFLYLGDVDERIQMPRHKRPRTNVEKGSVGIAENQTGIYPTKSSGGWQIIGKTPLDLFNVDKTPPSLFNPGDKIQFYPIGLSEFKKLEKSNNLLEKFIQHD